MDTHLKGKVGLPGWIRSDLRPCSFASMRSSVTYCEAGEVTANHRSIKEFNISRGRHLDFHDLELPTESARLNSFRSPNPPAQVRATSRLTATELSKNINGNIVELGSF